MKKSLVVGMLGLAAVAAPSFGQGYIWLDNYDSHGGDGGPLITYGSHVYLNGVSGAFGAVGVGLNSSWTVGIYFVEGTPSITDPAGIGFPDPRLSLGTGVGSTAQVASLSVFGAAGCFLAASCFNTGAPLGSVITAELVVYPTAAGSYAYAVCRGHSAPFVMAPVAPSAPQKPLVGDYFTGFSAQWIPEPSILALAGLGGLSLWLLRRKKA